MHILHIIDGLGLGGAERMLVDIANATVADGHRVSVCITRNDTTIASDLDRRIALLVLDRRHRLSVSASVRLATWSRNQHVDVLHVHMRSSCAYVLVLRAVRMIRIPIVFHDHYGTIEVDTSVPTWFRVGHRLIDHYVGVYDKLRDWAQLAGMPAEKTTTIANAMDLSRLAAGSSTELRAELGVAATTSVGILVATVRRDKGIELLIDAVAKSRHRDQIRVVVVGAAADPAYAEECRIRVQESRLDGNITFLGGRRDVPGLLRDVEFAVLSSHTESGPLVLIEYLAAGLPIVSTLVGDIGRRLAAMGVPGFVPPRDPAAFADALDELLGLSQAERRERAEIGRRALTEAWDIRVTMPRWYAVYRSSIGRRP